MSTWSNVIAVVESMVNPFYPFFSAVLAWTVGIATALIIITVLVCLGVAVILGAVETRSAKKREADPSAPEDPLSVFD